jgi:DNA-binding NtrC family response regulator
VKQITGINTESIVFIVENNIVRRMLGMYLAAAGLDARIYTSQEDYSARHDSSRTQYLVLDMQLPGMDGAILWRQKIVDQGLNEKNSETFQLIPIRSKWLDNALLSMRMISRDVVSDGTGVLGSEFWGRQS